MDKSRNILDRNYWQKTLEEQEPRRGYSDGFKLLYSPWSVIELTDMLFLSLNPGNDPSGEFMRVASDERGNSYLVQRDAKHSPIAVQFQRLCSFVGRDPEEVLTGVIMPFRTPNWNPLRDRKNIAVTRPFWQHVTSEQKIRHIFCMGREVEEEAVALTNAVLVQEIAANWGKLSIRRYEAENGVQIYGLLHFSTYKMFQRPQCVQQLEILLKPAMVDR